MTKTRIAREIGVWLLTLLLVLMFGAAGIEKFTDNRFWILVFRTAGYPDWFRLLIGAVETAAAVLILVPRTAAYGAASMIVVMIGALATVFSVHVPRLNAFGPSVAIVVATIVLIARWRQRALFMGSHPPIAMQ